MTDQNETTGLSRRRFIGTSATSAAFPILADAVGSRANATPTQGETSTLVPVTLNVNGQRRDLALDPRTTLLDALRDHVGLTGAKKGCDHGQCGACTVLVDGHGANACLVLALSAQNHAITTIEGIANADGTLHPVQQAFIDNDAFQCGYCTPGQIMSSVDCIGSGKAGSDADIREFMSGNICRCGAYPNIVAAISDAKTKMGG